MVFPGRTRAAAHHCPGAARKLLLVVVGEEAAVPTDAVRASAKPEAAPWKASDREVIRSLDSRSRSLLLSAALLAPPAASRAHTIMLRKAIELSLAGPPPMYVGVVYIGVHARVAPATSMQNLAIESGCDWM